MLLNETPSTDDKTLLAGVLILAGGQSTRMGTAKALLTLPTGETLLDYHVKAARKLAKPVLIADNQQGFAVSKENDVSFVHYIQDYLPDGQSGNQPSNQSNRQLDYQSNRQLDNQSSSQANTLKEEASVGPLGAILAGLQQINELIKQQYDDYNQNLATQLITERWLLVVSCDSLVTAEDIWRLLANTTTATAEDGDNEKSPSVICLTDNDNLYPLLGLYRLDCASSLKTYLDSKKRRVMRFIDPLCQTVPMPAAWRDLSNLNTPNQFDKAVALVQCL